MVVVLPRKRARPERGIEMERFRPGFGKARGLFDSSGGFSSSAWEMNNEVEKCKNVGAEGELRTALRAALSLQCFVLREQEGEMSDSAWNS